MPWFKPSTDEPEEEEIEEVMGTEELSYPCKYFKRSIRTPGLHRSFSQEQFSPDLPKDGPSRTYDMMSLRCWIRFLEIHFCGINGRRGNGFSEKIGG
jgi:hypothetical protein